MPKKESQLLTLWKERHALRQETENCTEAAERAKVKELRRAFDANPTGDALAAWEAATRELPAAIEAAGVRRTGLKKLQTVKLREILTELQPRLSERAAAAAATAAEVEKRADALREVWPSADLSAIVEDARAFARACQRTADRRPIDVRDGVLSLSEVLEDRRLAASISAELDAACGIDPAVPATTEPVRESEPVAG